MKERRKVIPNCKIIAAINQKGEIDKTITFNLDIVLSKLRPLIQLI